MPKRVLVTGVAGFIGSHVSQALLRRGDIVIGIDNLNEYYTTVQKHANLQEVMQNVPFPKSFIFVQGDIRVRESVENVLNQHGCDCAVHLAAMAGVRASLDNPPLYFETNLSGTLNVLQAAVNHKLSNVLLASTSSVYGKTAISPFVETDSCDRPLSPYAASKRAAEMLGFTYSHVYGLCFTALRFFTVYGPRNRPDMMAYKLCESLFLGRQVPLYNRGQLYRDWTYIDDVVAGIIAALDRPSRYEIINLGRGKPVLLADFVDILESVSGRKAQLIDAPVPETDMEATFADIAKAQKLIGYNPRVSVEEGVARLWHWFVECQAHSQGIASSL